MKVKILLVFLSARNMTYLKVKGEIPYLYAFTGDDPETLAKKIYDKYVNYSYQWVDVFLSGCYIKDETVYIVFRSFVDSEDITCSDCDWQKIIEIKDEFISKLVRKASTF